MLRNLVFSKQLTPGWELWAMKRASQIVGVIVIFIGASSFLLDVPYPAFALALSCTASWFGIIGRYRMHDAILIGVGGIVVYYGILLFTSYEPISGSFVGLIGYLITTRFFSVGPARSQVPKPTPDNKRITGRGSDKRKETLRRKKPPSS